VGVLPGEIGQTSVAQRALLGLFDVIDLGGKIQSPQRHAEQEPESGHDAVANRPRLRQVQLEQVFQVCNGRPCLGVDRNRREEAGNRVGGGGASPQNLRGLPAARLDRRTRCLARK
jgi:hypothetical protein